MVQTYSMIYCVYLDLRRGLLNKRFWACLGIISFVFFLHIVLDGVWPLTKYYNGGEECFYLWGGRQYTAQGEIEVLNNLVLFDNFFPFIGAVAYAYSIMDDRRQKYCVQQIQRIGFSKYYWGKLLSSALLGGLLGMLCMAMICLLAVLLISCNPFIKDAVAFMVNWETVYDDKSLFLRYFGWSSNQAFFTIKNSCAWWFLGSVKYFVMGILYGLIASMIAFFTDNKVIMYAGPIIYLLLQDKWVYLALYLADAIFSVPAVADRFSLRSGRMLYGDLYHYFLLLFMIVLLLNLAKHFQYRAERFYMEGGNAGD